jgi:hypothetical protein
MFGYHARNSQHSSSASGRVLFIALAAQQIPAEQKTGCPRLTRAAGRSARPAVRNIGQRSPPGSRVKRGAGAGMGWVYSGGGDLGPGLLGSVAGDPDRHRVWLLCPSPILSHTLPPLSRFSVQAAAPALLRTRSGVLVFGARFGKTDSGFQEQCKKRIGGWRIPKTSCSREPDGLGSSWKLHLIKKKTAPAPGSQPAAPRQPPPPPGKRGRVPCSHSHRILVLCSTAYCMALRGARGT